MITIHYATGQDATASTLDGALGLIRHDYPEAVFYDHSGWAVLWEAPSILADLQEEGSRILVWADEATSTNDDGAKAVASLRWTQD